MSRATPRKGIMAAKKKPLEVKPTDWDRVVGLGELVGFAFADTPDRPVTGWDTLHVGGTDVAVIHPGQAHSAGDLMLWLQRNACSSRVTSW
jgi:glyoxylase-like metal-dependent hydrolase (beta-lactamase superfamily II)